VIYHFLKKYSAEGLQNIIISFRLFLLYSQTILHNRLIKKTFKNTAVFLHPSKYILQNCLKKTSKKLKGIETLTLQKKKLCSFFAGENLKKNCSFF